MKVIFYDKDLADSFEANIPNLLQLYDFLRVNKPAIYEMVNARNYSYTVYKRECDTAYPLLPEMLQSDLTMFDCLVIMMPIQGEAVISSVSAAIISAAAITSTWAIAAVYATVTVATIGIVYLLGLLIRSLTPNQKITGKDPTEVSKLFNGVPNITEQGGSVPIVYGSCLFGGVRIGLKLTKASESYADTRNVATFVEAMNYPGQWLRFV